MSSLVAWQPSGAIIVGSETIKSHQSTQKIIIWEKNGLRHLEFILPSFVVQVNAINWSLDSSVLVVEVQNKENGRQLLFYYRANYKWFLKSSVHLSA